MTPGSLAGARDWMGRGGAGAGPGPGAAPIAAPAAGRGSGGPPAPAAAVCAGVRCPVGWAAPCWGLAQPCVAPGTRRSAGRPLRDPRTGAPCSVQPRVSVCSPAAESPGAAPPPGALLRPSLGGASLRRPFPGFRPAAAPRAGPGAVEEALGSGPQQASGKTGRLLCKCSFFISGVKLPISILISDSLDFPNSLR